MILSKGAITLERIERMTMQELAEHHIRLVEAQGTHYFDFDRMRWVEIKK